MDGWFVGEESRSRSSEADEIAVIMRSVAQELVRFEAEKRKSAGHARIDGEERLSCHECPLQSLRRDYICPIEYAIL